MSNHSKVPEPITKGVANVPVVMQLEVLECGAASLTMIMNYYQKWIPLEQARVEIITRNGFPWNRPGWIAAFPGTAPALKI